MRRQLTHHERDFIERVAGRLDSSERHQLLEDAAVAIAEPLNDDGSIIRFHLAGYGRPPQSGRHSFTAEGIVRDADGASVTVLLHQDEHGRLYELEFVRYVEGDLIAPNWETLRVS